MTDLRAMIRDRGYRITTGLLRLVEAAYAAGFADATPRPGKPGRPLYGSTPAERKVIARIGKARKAGNSLRAIAAELDAEGIRPPGGGWWSPQAITNLARRAGQ